MPTEKEYLEMAGEKTTDIASHSESEMQELICFYVKEVYGNYGTSIKVLKDDSVDGLWIAFLQEKKTTLYAAPTLQEIYDMAFEEYEGCILYDYRLNSNQFDSLDIN